MADERRGEKRRVRDVEVNPLQMLRMDVKPVDTVAVGARCSLQVATYGPNLRSRWRS